MNIFFLKKVFVFELLMFCHTFIEIIIEICH